MIDWQHDKSHIQPCSVDLHIGQIFQPGEENRAAPGTLAARRDLVLATGQTAVVVTREVLNFPRNLAAFGFPPSHVSGKGLLMTNPGHVDPGYVGKLRFTVINMSAEPFPLRETDAIVTLLLFRLGGTIAQDWRARTGLAQLPDPAWNDVNRLAKDFVDVETRARKIAVEEVQKEKDHLNRLDTRTKWTTAWIGALAGILGIGGTLLIGWLNGIQDIKAKLSALESKTDVIKIERQMDDLKERVTALDKRMNTRRKNDCPYLSAGSPGIRCRCVPRVPREPERRLAA